GRWSRATAACIGTRNSPWTLPSGDPSSSEARSDSVTRSCASARIEASLVRSAARVIAAVSSALPVSYRYGSPPPVFGVTAPSVPPIREPDHEKYSALGHCPLALPLPDTCDPNFDSVRAHAASTCPGRTAGDPIG